MTDTIGTSTFVFADSEEEAKEKAAAKYPDGRLESVGTATKMSAKGWRVAVSLHRLPGGEAGEDWTAPARVTDDVSVGYGSDVDVPDPDEPGFDPIDRTMPASDKPPASFYDEIRRRGTRKEGRT